MTYSMRVFCPTCNDIFQFVISEKQTVDFDLEKAKCTHCDNTGLKQLESEG